VSRLERKRVYLPKVTRLPRRHVIKAELCAVGRVHPLGSVHRNVVESSSCRVVDNVANGAVGTVQSIVISTYDSVVSSWRAVGCCPNLIVCAAVRTLVLQSKRTMFVSCCVGITYAYDVLAKCVSKVLQNDGTRTEC
jgi:hypothetical protein